MDSHIVRRTGTPEGLESSRDSNEECGRLSKDCDDLSVRVTAQSAELCAAADAAAQQPMASAHEGNVADEIGEEQQEDSFEPSGEEILHEREKIKPLPSPLLPPTLVALEVNEESDELIVRDQALRTFFKASNAYIDNRMQLGELSMVDKAQEATMKANDWARRHVQEEVIMGSYFPSMERMFEAEQKIQELKAQVSVMTSQMSTRFGKIEEAVEQIHEQRRVFKQKAMAAFNPEDVMERIAPLIKKLTADALNIEEKLQKDIEALADQLDQKDKNAQNISRRIDTAELELKTLRKTVSIYVGDMPSGADGTGARAGGASVRASIVDTTTSRQQDSELVSRVDALEHSFTMISADLHPRVNELERLRRKQDVVLKDIGQNAQEAEEKLIAFTGRYDAACMAMESTAKALESKIAQQERTVAQNIKQFLTKEAYTDSKLQELAKAVKGQAMSSVERPCESSELTYIRGVLATLCGQLKSQEQSVLFGARCLSCNRCYDDVERVAGVVDPSAETFRLQALNEIEKALTSPRCDPLDPVNFISVKVGRTYDAQQQGGVMAHCRDTSLARGVEDVILLPARRSPRPEPRPPRRLAEPMRPLGDKRMASAGRRAEPRVMAASTWPSTGLRQVGDGGQKQQLLSKLVAKPVQ